MSEQYRPVTRNAARRLRDLLLEADYTVTGVRDRLGSTAARALAREEPVPALRATGGEERLGLLLRLWWLNAPVPLRPLASVLPVEDLVEAGLLLRGEDSTTVRAAVRVKPHDLHEGPGYVVSDPTVLPGQGGLREDHVISAGHASRSLASLLVTSPVNRALDLGTGSGVQAVELAGRAGEVWATDVNPRALWLAEWSCALSGVDNVQVRAGSFYEPVQGQRFDLIASNPPFVITPDTARYAYRESDLPGDEVCASIVRQAPGHLTDGGWCQLLGNWLHIDGEEWRGRVEGWVAGTGCSGWVVQREVLDPAEYVELWLRDSCELGTPEYTRRYDAWLDYFEREGVEGIGFGWISLRNDSAADATVRVEELRHEIEMPVGAYLPEVVDGAMTAHRLSDEALLAARLALAPDVVEERVSRPGAADPERIVLRQRSGPCRAAQVGTVEAALASVCDGTMPVGPLLDAIAELTGNDAAHLRRSTPTTLRGLIAEGFFRVTR